MRRVEPSTTSYPSAVAGSSAPDSARTPGRLFLQPACPPRLAPRSRASLASSPEGAVSRSPTTTGPCTRLPAMVGPTRRTDRAYLVSAESGSWPRRDCSRKPHKYWRFDHMKRALMTLLVPFALAACGTAATNYGGGATSSSQAGPATISVQGTSLGQILVDGNGKT